MAITFPTDSDYLSRLANLPLIGAFTIAGWAKRTADTDLYTGLAVLAGSGTVGAWFGTTNDGTTLSVLNDNSQTDFSQSPNQDQWFYFAMIGAGISAGQLSGRWKESGGLTWKSITHSVTSVTLDRFDLGTFASSRFPGSTCCVRMWDAVLSEAELDLELLSRRAVRTANLNIDWRLHTNANMLDQSGNLRHPTVNGAPGTDTDEPLEISNRVVTIQENRHGWK